MPKHLHAELIASLIDYLYEKFEPDSMNVGALATHAVAWHLQKLDAAKREAEELVTYDSYPLGWDGDKHNRVIVAIRGGKIINSAATTDDNIKQYGGGGSIVTEAHIQEYGEKFLPQHDKRESN